MPARILLSTAYLPPVEYFARLHAADNVLIERAENYIKQTYRNRCYILSSGGYHKLTIPVLLGSFHKTPVNNIRIDYSKRWQQVHTGAIVAAYRSSPFFIYYFEAIEKIIMKGHEYLLDLNTELLKTLCGMLNIKAEVNFTSDFSPPGKEDNDFRYSIAPKIKSSYCPKAYARVFNTSESESSGVSIIDLLFNTGPDAVLHL